MSLSDAAICAEDRRRVPGGEKRAEDRLHNGPAEIALEIGIDLPHAAARYRY